MTSLGRSLKPVKVLDVGTGNGSTLPTWLKQGWEVCAMEPDRGGYEIARSYESATVRQLGAGDALPPEWCEAFDLVLSLEVVGISSILINW